MLAAAAASAARHLPTAEPADCCAKQRELTSAATLLFCLVQHWMTWLSTSYTPVDDGYYTAAAAAGATTACRHCQLALGHFRCKRCRHSLLTSSSSTPLAGSGCQLISPPRTMVPGSSTSRPGDSDCSRLR
jgi:hypothetical protein